MDDVLQPLGYPALVDVRGRESVAALYPDRARPGVCVMQFETGEWFVDKTIDVVARHARYQSCGLAVARLSFLPLDLDALGPTEEATVARLKAAGGRTRRVDPAVDPGVGADFDLVMSAAAQALWLDTGVDDDSPRRESAARRPADRFAELSALREWPDVAAVLRRYLRLGVPVARAGEVTFWCCTCLPASRDGQVLVRINLNWQEVCTVVEDREPEFSFHLARSAVDLARVLAVPRVYVTDHRYRPGGDDQVNVVARGRRAAHALLNDPGVVQGIRRFNLRLLRRGLCQFGQYHCFELADALLSDAPIELDSAAAFRSALARVDQLVAWERFDDALVVLIERCAVPGRELSRREVDAVCAGLEVLQARVTGGRARDAICVLLAGAADARGDDETALAWCGRLGSRAAAPYAALIALAIAARCSRRRGRPEEGVGALEDALNAAMELDVDEYRPAVLRRVEEEIARCRGFGDGRTIGSRVAQAVGMMLAALARWSDGVGLTWLARAWLALADGLRETRPEYDPAAWTWEQIAAACLDLPRLPAEPLSSAPYAPILDGIVAGGFSTYIAGTAYEGRHLNLAAVVDGAPLRLVREPANPYDPNAVKIFHGDAPLGYVPAIHARHLAPLIDLGESIVACAVVRATSPTTRAVDARLSRG